MCSPFFWKLFKSPNKKSPSRKKNTKITDDTASVVSNASVRSGVKISILLCIYHAIKMFYNIFLTVVLILNYDMDMFNSFCSIMKLQKHYRYIFLL